MNDFARLCRSELHRLVARRLTRILALVYVGIIVTMCVIAFATHSKDASAGSARAERQRAEVVQSCLDSRSQEPPGEGRPTIEQCQSLQTADNDKRWGAKDTKDAVQGMIGVGALLAFVLGASAGGAEWAAKTMQALLFWEPRRVRVIAAKTLALSAVVTTVAVVGQFLTVAGTWIVTLTRGTTEGFTHHAWAQIVASQGRGIAVVVLAALAAFSLSSLTRNTGAALGAAFAYLVILEQVLRAWKPWSARYLLTPNIGALISGRFEFDDSGTSIAIGSGRAGFLLCLYVGALLAVATGLFVRRDVT